jgi:outer membrane protein
MTIKKYLSAFLAWSFALYPLQSPVQAQQPFVEKPQGRILWRPYQQPHFPPVILTNSDRLHSLMRGGNLYLTLQDAIALAIENNLDLQVDRYGPLEAQWDLERQHAGGPLKGVTSGNSAVNQITSGQGANGALVTAGLTSNSGGSAGNNNNGNISQIGPITPNLDAVFQNSTSFTHQTTPEPNVYYYGTPALVDDFRRYFSFIQQGLITGGYVQFTGNESYLKENSPYDVINPDYAPVAQITLVHSLLQGFGKGVNSRYIRVSKNKLAASSITFKAQLSDLVQNVVNLYWDLAASNQDLKAKQAANRDSDKFNEETKRRIELGAIAKVEAFRAEADLASRKQDVAIALQTVSQQETQLKGYLSRTGLEDPELDVAKVVLLDRIQVPESDDLPPLRELVATAMTHRTDVQLDKINDENAEISSAGTKNNLLPVLQGRVSTTSRATAGPDNPASGIPPAPFSVGGLGTALGQIARHDYTSRAGTLSFQPYIGNRAAQADYGIDQLQLRQGDLTERRNRNDMVVAISNDMIALRQARSRYSLAVSARELQQDLLEKEQQKFSLGSSTIDLIIAQERALSAAQYTEISALSTYSHTRVALDQVLGLTLDTNHVSIEEALKGRVERTSVIPDVAPEQGR